MWESQVLLTDGQVVFLRVLRFSPTFDERSARYKWNILERAVKPKSKKKKKKKKKKKICMWFFQNPEIFLSTLTHFELRHFLSSNITVYREQVHCPLSRPWWRSWMRIRLETRKSRVRSPPRSATFFVEIDHEIFSTVILSLPLIQEGQLSVSGERMCTILVNRIED